VAGIQGVRVSRPTRSLIVEFKPGTQARKQVLDRLAAPPPTAATTPPTIPIAQFWTYDHPLEPSLVVISPPPSSETILDTLGPIPFATNALGTAATHALSSQATMQYLQTVYQATSQQAVVAALSTGSND